MEHRWKVLIVVSVAAFMASLDLFIVNIAFPAISADFSGSSVSELSWVLNAYAIVFAALLVPAGRFADRIGHRKGFLWGVAVFVIGSALCGAAPSLGALVGARILQAMGAAMLLPTSLALLLPGFPPSQRAVAVSIWAAIGAVAAACGPPLGGLLVEASWRWVFLVNIPVGIAALLYARRLLGESVARADRRIPDLAGTAVLIVSISLICLGLVEAPTWGWGSAQTIGAIGAGLVGAGIFWRRCLTQPVPVVDPSFLRVRSYAAAITAMALYSTAFAAMLLGAVLYLTIVWGESALTAGVMLAAGPLTAAIFAVPAGRMAASAGQSLLAGVGSIVFALGCTWFLVRLGPTPDYAGELLPGMILTGIGVGLTLPSLSSAAAGSLPPESFATGSAVLTMSRQIGSVLGVALLIAVLGGTAASGSTPDFDAGFVLMVVTALIASASAFAIGRVEPASQPEVGLIEEGSLAEGIAPPVGA